MKLSFIIAGLVCVHHVVSACPTCVGNITDTCPTFFSAACYAAPAHDDQGNLLNDAQDDILILKGEHDHEENK